MSLSGIKTLHEAAEGGASKTEFRRSAASLNFRCFAELLAVVVYYGRYKNTANIS